MSQVFSTERLPVAHRLQAWQFSAKGICGDCRYRFPKWFPFRGSIERRELGGLEFTRFTSSPVSFTEFPNVRDREAQYLIITQLEGVRRYVQESSVTVLSPGDSTIVDSRRAWFSDCQGQSSRLYLRVPISLMHNRVRVPSLPLLPHVCGQAGIGATLSRLAVSLYEQSENIQLDEGIEAVQAYFELLSIAMGYHPGRPHAQSLLARAEGYIENNLTDPALEPGVIASAIRISTRHLHRLFSAKECTVTEWIREQRLERCRKDLSERRGDATITEIAFRWGFSDSAHFSRSFRNKFGVSPREYRDQKC